LLSSNDFRKFFKLVLHNALENTLGILAHNQLVMILNFRSLKGWIYSGDIYTSKATVTQPTKVVTTGEVILRKGASTGYSVVLIVQKAQL
jgi:hypothetical protein